MAVIETGNDSAGRANVDSEHNLLVAGPGRTADGTPRGGGEAAGSAAVIFSENDPGEKTGLRSVASPETDGDYRLRVGTDLLLDVETFNYAAQNTGKHLFTNTTMLAAWTVTGLQLNSGAITTTTTGARVRTWAEFPVGGAMQLYVEQLVSFSLAACPANCFVDFGAFRDAGANPFEPSDGAFFSLSAAGLMGVYVVGGGSPVAALLDFTWVAGRVYKFAVVVTEKNVEWWIDDVLYAELPRATTENQPLRGTSAPWAIRQTHIGAAGAAFQATVRDYTISLGGLMVASSMAEQGNRIYGSYQGLSGGAALGQLSQWANAALPTAAAGTNTTAALGTGLGGLFQLNAPATSATDVILSSYQVPAGTTAVQGRRLAIRGVWVAAANLIAAVATTETALALGLAFGHTAVSLATAEAATAKAPRRIGLGILSWAIGAAAGAPPREGSIYRQFTSPVFVNPGEFVAVICKPLVGTATATEVFCFDIGFDAGWE
jgi:hypothetical protein